MASRVICAFNLGQTVPLEIASIDLASGIVATECGLVGEVVLWLDLDGDETEDSSEALAAVARIGWGTWLAIDISQFEPVEVH